MTFEELLQNKYVLYVTLGLAVTNVIGYAALKNNDALIMFFVTGVLTAYFSKNMIVIMLSAMLLTNFIVVGRKGMQREGFDDPPRAVEAAKLTSTQEEEDGDDDKDAFRWVRGKYGKASEEDVQEIGKMKNNYRGERSIEVQPMIVRQNDNNTSDKEPFTPDLEYSSLKPNNGRPKRSDTPRLDQSATLEQAYTDLEKLLSPDQMKGLSADTQSLINQQQQLGESIKQIAPLLNTANNMMQTLGSAGAPIGKLLDKVGGLLGSAQASGQPIDPQNVDLQKISEQAQTLAAQSKQIANAQSN